MKDIERELREIEKALAAEDNDTTSGPTLSPLASSLILWGTMILVSAFVLWSFLS